MEKTTEKPFVSAIIVAAGASTRMGGAGSKQMLMLSGKPVIAHTLAAFQAAQSIAEIILVARAEDREQMQELQKKYQITKCSRIVPGGRTRQLSVAAGVQAAHPHAAYIAIHDGARPLITPACIDEAVASAFSCQACTVGTPVVDTIKQVDGKGKIIATPERSALWAVQTPQVFLRSLYLAGLAKARGEGLDFTDDCQLAEAMGVPVTVVPGKEENIKITSPKDIDVAQALLLQRTQEENSMRIGHGYDVHRLVEGRKLVLGGVRIPFAKGLLGHSDADVLLHAVADALLGAAALGDIGGMFPDNDPQYQDADSLVLLQKVAARVREAGYFVVNLDATVLAQAPKLKPFIPEMRKNIASACIIQEEKVNVKATTEEGLGFTGHGEGIAAHAVCLLDKIKK